MPASCNPFVKFTSAVALMLCAMLAGALPASARGEIPGTFDHYVLSLSWSPTYCADEGRGRDKDAMQCNAERPFSFIAHGLWPQYGQGWPEFCSTRDRWVPNKVINSVIDIMPSKGLIIHEWRRHGSCSGLSQDQYFGLIRSLFTNIDIPAKYQMPEREIVTTPDALKADLLAANPQLDPSMITVYCGSRKDRSRLSEVRVCYDRQGEPTACGTSDHRRQCRAQSLIIPAVRSQ